MPWNELSSFRLPSSREFSRQIPCRPCPSRSKGKHRRQVGLVASVPAYVSFSDNDALSAKEIVFHQTMLLFPKKRCLLPTERAARLLLNLTTTPLLGERYPFMVEIPDRFANIRPRSQTPTKACGGAGDNATPEMTGTRLGVIEILATLRVDITNRYSASEHLAAGHNRLGRQSPQDVGISQSVFYHYHL